MINSIKSLRAKIAANQDALAVAGICTAVAGFLAAVTYVTIKVEGERNQIIDDALAAGKTVLPGPNGLTWIVDNDQNVTAL